MSFSIWQHTTAQITQSVNEQLHYSQEDKSLRWLLAAISMKFMLFKSRTCDHVCWLVAELCLLLASFELFPASSIVYKSAIPPSIFFRVPLSSSPVLSPVSASLRSLGWSHLRFGVWARTQPGQLCWLIAVANKSILFFICTYSYGPRYKPYIANFCINVSFDIFLIQVYVYQRKSNYLSE